MIQFNKILIQLENQGVGHHYICINFTFLFSEFASQVILDQSGPPDQLKLKTAKDLGTIEEEFKNKTWLYEFKGEVSGMPLHNIQFHFPKLGC